MNNKQNNKITSRDVDFAKWFTDVVMAAHLASYSNTKGCIVFEPNGFAIWENMKKVLDDKFKELGHRNVYMPMLIPESLLKKESDLVAGFAPEVAWVTQGGNNELEERLCIRPTSETLFSDYYRGVVNSYRDLPKLYNQWCSVLRWEKETRPFLRGREFLWQEGHTLHETREEAEAETLTMLNVYNNFFHDYLAIPSIVGKKTEKEKFAGAEYTCTVEALMYNGVTLQSATSHYFGQKFSQAYDIKFTNRENKLSYPYQTSWGATTRMIGALIMVHSDNYGLVLPPKIAPYKVVIVPINDDLEVMSLAHDYLDKLKANGIESYIDDSERSAGYKFAEAEVNGIPVRIEIGKRDLDNDMITLVRRDTREKMQVFTNTDIIHDVKVLLEDIQRDMYDRALRRREEMTYTCTDLEEFKDIINNHPGFIKAMWCGDAECENKIKEIRGCKSRCIPFGNETVGDKCIVCGREAKELVIWGIQY